MWGLELENLPLESLILIYSDFRVKNKENSNDLYCLQDVKKIDRLYLNNLKSSTDAIIKKVQIDRLRERAILNREETVYTALHFCNILKVSSHEPIRNYADKVLINIIPCKDLLRFPHSQEFITREEGL